MMNSITVLINGEMREVPAEMSVPALLMHLGLRPERVALERNLEILPRSEWDATRIVAGDKLEIVHLVGGGS